METLFADALWSEGYEAPNELRQCMHYSNTSGKLYVATDDGKIRYTEVRQQLLSGEWSENKAEASSIPPSITTLQPNPEIDLTITSFAVNRSGSHAIICGPTLTDPEITAVYILDLTARRHSSHGHITVPSIPLDEDLFSTHPGLQVLQITWHPDSDTHIAILTSDSTWRLYDTSQPQLAEQTFELLTITGRRGLIRLSSPSPRSSPSPSQHKGLLSLQDNTTTDTDNDDNMIDIDSIVSFCFGTGDGWSRFSVYFLSKKGRIYLLCPVAPFNARYPSRLINALRCDVELSTTTTTLTTTTLSPSPSPPSPSYDGDRGQTVEAWLQRAFTPVSTLSTTTMDSSGGSNSSGGIGVPELEVCCPHALDSHSPLLTGPLHIHTSTMNSNGSNSNSGGSSGSTTTEEYLFNNTNATIVKAESIVLWNIAGGACSVLCIATDAGTVAVHLVAGSPVPQWHAAVPQCVLDGDGEVRAVRMQCSGSSSSGSGSNNNSMNTSHGGGEYGIDSSTTTNSSGVQLLLVDVITVPSSNNNKTITTTDNDDDGDNDGHPGQTPGSQSAILTLDPSSDDTLYYILPRQLYCITLPWIAHLAHGLSAVLHDNQPLPSTVSDVFPSPTVNMLYNAGECGIAAAVSVGDALCGSGVIILLDNNKHECIHPMKHIKTVVDDSKKEESKNKVSGGDEDVQSIIDRIYKEVLQGPIQQNNNNNNSGGGGGDEVAQMQRVLLDATTRLRGSHVEYIHKAHHTLSERLEQVRDEVTAQEERAQRITALTKRVQAANAQLETGVQRAQWMSENLSRRLHLLAELHWALPKPASLAESSFRKKELPVLEDAARKLESSVVTVGARITALKEKQQREEQVSSFGGGDVSIPPQQLRRIRELLAEHERAIRMARQQANALESALSGY